MAESKPRKVYIVTNPGSDSDDSNEDIRRRLRGHGIHLGRHQHQHPLYTDYQSCRPPSQPTSDLPLVNGSSSLHQAQPHHPLSVESNGSPVVEEPPPTQVQSPTPVISHPVDLQLKVQGPPKTDPHNSYDRPINETALAPHSVGTRKFSTPKAPFGSRPRPSGDSSRRLRSSPTTSMSDTYTPSANTPPTSTASSIEKIVMVTADSDRYVKVDISAAKTALHIRELILTKLNIFDDDEFHPYSIYQTEIGHFAIGEALSNDNLVALCRDHADFKGSLKFFVSVASASVHEAPPPVQHIEQHTIPPVLSSMVSVNPLSYNKRRSRSRNGSFSSQSENLHKDGYDADDDNPDRNSNKSISRLSPQQAGAILSSASATQSQPPRRRPTAVHRPSSPLVPPEQSSHAQSSAWVQRKEEKYVHAPPMSPQFSTQDELSSATVPGRYPPPISTSNLAAERELALKASEQLDAHNQSAALESRSLGKLRSTSRENLSSQTRRPYDEDDLPWDTVPTTSGGREDSERVSPSVPRGTRPQTAATSSGRFRTTSPYSSRSRPIPPPITALQDTRTSQQQRTGRQQPLPPNYVVTWKGEEAGNRKSSLASTPFRIGKGVPKPKSMDNLKPSPTSASSWRNIPPALPTRPSGNITYSLLSGTPKSYDPPRGSSFVRPLPAQGSPLPTASEFSSQTSSSTHSLRTLSTNITYPNQDPFPRPSSAAGDSATSPIQGYLKISSPVYGGSGEPHRSPRAISPQGVFSLNNGISGSRPTPNNYSDPSDRSSDIQSGPETSTTPPRTPISPQSPRCDSQEQKRFGCEPFIPSPVDNPIIEDNGPSDTITQEHRRHFDDLVSIEEYVVLPRPQPQPTVARQTITQTQPKAAYGADEEDDDESDNGGGTWIVRPSAVPKSPRPPLTVQIEDSTPITSSMRQSSRPEVPLTAPIRRDGLSSRQPPRRPQSTFVDEDDDSWAPRPPPENIYDHLEKFFPTHDLDKPVIDTTSGDTSPTTTEAVAALPPPVPVSDEKSKIRAKKSIRIVAQEHKKRIDRTSKQADPPANSNLRKRNTKLWGSRLEEVTTGQARSMTSTPDSPSGGPTTFKWVRGELIGKGTYGRVYLALNATTGEMIAVKQVELPQTASDKTDSRQHMVVQALKSESETLRDLDHPNIVQYLGFEETPTNLSIFLEYVPGGSIGRSLIKHGKFEDNVTRSFTSQILGGLEYLHSKGILHRDLKADNILVEMTGVCKISDFGISKRTEDLHGGAFTAMQGSVFWMAPEVINTQKNGYNNKIDIWSVGCVVLEMWAGMRPWNGEEMLAVMFKLYQSKQPPPIPEDVVLSEDADDFRRKCFAINPDDRPTAAELRKHRYLVLPPDWVFAGFT